MEQDLLYNYFYLAFTLEVSGTIVGSKFTVDYTVSENAILKHLRNSKMSD